MLENVEDLILGLIFMYVVVVFLFVYMCFCMFYFFYKLGMFSFYMFVFWYMDVFLFLVNVSLVCCYLVLLSFNFFMFLFIICVSGKMIIFLRKMVNNVLEFAGELNIIVFMFLGLYCVVIVFGWFDCIVCVFNVEGFKFDSDKDVNESMEIGKLIVDRERVEVMDGVEIGSLYEFFVFEIVFCE